MTTDIYLVCTLLGGDWAGIGHSASHGQEKTGGFCSIFDKLCRFGKKILAYFQMEVSGDFSLRKFFNLGNKPIMNDDEVGKSLKSCPIGELVIN